MCLPVTSNSRTLSDSVGVTLPPDKVMMVDGLASANAEDLPLLLWV